MSEPDAEHDSGVPQNFSQLKKAIEAGDCFLWEYYNRRMYFEWVDGVGIVYTETDEHGNDPFTTAAGDEELRTALKFGGVDPVDPDDIPGEEVAHAE